MPVQAGSLPPACWSSTPTPAPKAQSSWMRANIKAETQSKCVKSANGRGWIGEGFMKCHFLIQPTKWAEVTTITPRADVRHASLGRDEGSPLRSPVSPKVVSLITHLENAAKTHDKRAASAGMPAQGVALCSYWMSVNTCGWPACCPFFNTALSWTQMTIPSPLCGCPEKGRLEYFCFLSWRGSWPLG